MARGNPEGLANYKIIENKDDKEHYIFRVVCERQNVKSEKAEVKNGS